MENLERNIIIETLKELMEIDTTDRNFLKELLEEMQEAY